MRIRMKNTRNFVPPDTRRVTVKFLEGAEYTVKRAWGEQLVADGDAREVRAPRRAEHGAEGEAEG